MFAEGLARFGELETPDGIAECMEGLAGALAARQPLLAAELVGAADALRNEVGAARVPLEQQRYERITAVVQARIGDHVFDTCWTKGRAMEVKQAIAYALEHGRAKVD